MVRLCASTFVSAASFWLLFGSRCSPWVIWTIHKATDAASTGATTARTEAMAQKWQSGKEAVAKLHATGASTEAVDNLLEHRQKEAMVSIYGTVTAMEQSTTIAATATTTEAATAQRAS